MPLGPLDGVAPVSLLRCLNTSFLGAIEESLKRKSTGTLGTSCFPSNGIDLPRGSFLAKECDHPTFPALVNDTSQTRNNRRETSNATDISHVFAALYLRLEVAQAT